MQQGESASERREFERAIERDGRHSFAFAVSGFVVMAVGGCMMFGGSGTLPVWASTIGFAFQAAGTALLVVGLGFYSRKKGRSVVLGGLGLLSWIGVAVLAVMPKLCHRCRARVSARAKRCGECGTPA